MAEFVARRANTRSDAGGKKEDALANLNAFKAKYGQPYPEAVRMSIALEANPL